MPTDLERVLIEWHQAHEEERKARWAHGEHQQDWYMRRARITGRRAAADMKLKEIATALSVAHGGDG